MTTEIRQWNKCTVDGECTSWDWKGDSVCEYYVRDDSRRPPACRFQYEDETKKDFQVFCCNCEAALLHARLDEL